MTGSRICAAAVLVVKPQLVFENPESMRPAFLSRRAYFGSDEGGSMGSEDSCLQRSVSSSSSESPALAGTSQDTRCVRLGMTAQAEIFTARTVKSFLNRPRHSSGDDLSPSW